MTDIDKLRAKLRAQIERSGPGTYSVLFSDLRALLDHIDMLEETYKDSNGDVWCPPTAWAYAKVCEARNNWQARAEAAEKERDEANRLNGELGHLGARLAIAEAELARLRAPVEGEVGEVVKRLGRGICYDKCPVRDKVSGCDCFIAADLIQRLDARVREGERVMREIADNVLMELNPSNYDHDDVCALNAASVEAILAIRNYLPRDQTNDRS